MAITDADAIVPVELRTHEFVLRPIVADDAERDYEAVMDTREALRLWRQSTWPEDDFTLEANREDVVDMAERHAARRAYNYTVVDPSGRRCLGCVYVFPPTATFLARAAVTALDGGEWAALDAVVFFWVRREQMADGMDGRLLAALRTWFAKDWGLADVVFAVSAPCRQQVELLEGTDLTRRFEVQEPDSPEPRLVFG
jgi:hypothetical protein